MSQSIRVRCSPGYFLISLVSGGAQFVLFCSADSFYFSSHLVSSVLVACLRCELRPSVVRLLASTWCGILWFIWCHRLRCLSYRSIQLPFAAYCPLDSLGGATASLCILPTSPLSCPQGSRFSAVIGLCRSLWRPLAAAAEVASDSSAS